MDSIFGFYFLDGGSSFWADNIVSIIGLIIALLTFIVERYLTTKREKENNKLNWYLNIIVLPHLEKLSVFYQETEIDLKAAINVLSTNTNPTNNLVLISGFSHTFKNKKNTLCNDFMALISSYSPDLSYKVQVIINELEDYYVKQLDDYNNFNMSSVINIHSNKEKLYKILFQALNSK